MEGPRLCDGCGKAMTPKANHRWKMSYFSGRNSYACWPFDSECDVDLPTVWKTFEACGEECLLKAASSVMAGKEPQRYKA